MKSTLRIVLPSLLALALAGSARAQNNDFIPASGAYDTPANWTLGHVPETSETARISITNNQSVTLSSGTFASGPLLMGASALTGTLTVSGGQLSYGGASTLATNGATVSLVNGGGTLIFSNNLTLATSTGTATYASMTNNSGTVRVEGNMLLGIHNGAGSQARGMLTVNGGTVTVTGRLIAANATAYSYVALNGGVLEIGAFTNSGSASARDIRFNGGTLRAVRAEANFLPVTSFATQFSNLVQNGGAFIDTQGFAITIATPLLRDGVSTGGLTKTGSGTLTLSGASTFTGGVRVVGGTIKMGNVTSLGAFVPGRPVSQVIVNSGCAIDFNGVADATYGYTISGTGVAGNGALLNTGGGISTGNAQMTNLRLAGDAAIGGTGNFCLLANGYAATSLDLNNFNLTKIGANTFTLCNSTLTTGSITINGGVVDQHASAGTVNAAAAHFVLANTAGVALNLNNKTLAIASLSGGGSTGGAINLGSGTLTISQTSNTTFNGPITGTGGLVKDGAGTLTIGGSNTFSGSTAINAGKLVLGANGSITNSTNIIVAGGAVLDVTAKPQLNLAAGQVLRGSGLVTGNVFTAASSLILAGSAGTPGTLTIGGNLSLDPAFTNVFDLTNSLAAGGGTNDLLSIAGGLDPSDNVIVINPLAPLVSGSYRLIDYGGLLEATFNTNVLGNTTRNLWVLNQTNANQINLEVTAGSLQTLQWNPVVSADWDVTSSNWVDAATATVTDRFYELDNVVFNEAGAASNVVNLATSLKPTAVTVNGASNYTFSGAGRISNPAGITASLTKDGAGTLTVLTTNTYGGGTTISNGVVQLGAGGNAGTLGSGPVANNGTLVFNHSDTNTLAQVISGTGSVTKAGPGTVTLTGTNTYTGPTTISGGSLTIGGAGQLGGGTYAGAVSNDGVFTFASSASQTNSGALSGTGVLTKSGAGALALGGAVANSHTGLTTVSQGILILGKTAGAVAIPGHLVLGPGNANQPEAIMAQPNQFGSASLLMVSNTVNNWARFSLMGKDQALAGLTDAGGLVLQNGSLAAGVGPTNATLTLNLTTTNNNVSGFIRDNDNVSHVQKISLVQNGTGRLTVAGANISYQGSTTVNGGTLMLNLTADYSSSSISNEGSVIFYASNAAYAVNSVLLGGGSWTVDGNGGGTPQQNRVILRGLASSSTSTITVINGGKLWLDRNNNSIADTVTVNLLTTSSQFIVYSDATAANQVNETIGGLTGIGAVYGYLGSGAVQPALAVGGGNATASFAGTIGDQNGSKLNLTKVGTGTQTLTGTNTYAGNTTISAGTLALAGGGSISNSQLILVAAAGKLDVSARPGFTLNTNQTLYGRGTVTGDVIALAGAQIRPDGFNSRHTLTFKNALGLNAGSTNWFDLTTATDVGGGTNDLVVVDGLLEPSNSVIQVNPVLPLASGTYTLFTYTGTKTTTFNTVVLGNTTRKTWTLDEAPAGLVNLTVGGGYANLVWLPQTNAVWDQGTTNWFDTVSSTTTRFFNADDVTFDDTGAYSNVVTLAGTLAPASIVVNSTSNYTLQGTGKISGTTGLTKKGTNVFTLANTGGNDFAGAIVVAEGRLQRGQTTVNAFGAPSSITVSNGAQVLMNGAGADTGTRGLSYRLSGAGPDGFGAIYNNAGFLGAYAEVLNVTLLSDTTIGSVSQRMSIGTGVSAGIGGWLDGQGYTLTINNGTNGFVDHRGASSNLVGVIVSNGAFGAESANNNLGAYVRVEAGAELNGASCSQTARVILVGATLAGRVGAATWNGPVELQGDSTFSTTAREGTAADFAVSGTVSGAYNLSKRGGGNVTLGGPMPNTYSGTTTVFQGAVYLTKPTGPAIPGDLVFDNNLSPDVYTLLDGQLSPNAVVIFTNDVGDNGRLELLGTTQTVAGLQTTYATARGVVQNREMGPANSGTSMLVLSGAGNYSFGGYLRNSTGVLALNKNGSGTQTLFGTVIDYSGQTIIGTGTLRCLDLDDIWSSPLTISPGGTLEFSTVARNFRINGAITVTGTGTFVKSGPGSFTTGFSAGYTRWQMAGGLIDVQAGTFINDYGDQNVAWVNNRASMNVAAGATVSLVGGNLITVDALTGAGTVNNINNWGIGVFTVGANGGSGSFNGTLADAAGILALTKVGTGTQTLSGTSTYSGTTTISNGVLALGATGLLTGPTLITSATGGTFDVSAVTGYTLPTNQTLGGRGFVAGTVTVSNVSSLIRPGPVSGGGTGQLTMATLNLGTTPTSTSRVNVTLGQRLDTLRVTNGLAFNGTVQLGVLDSGSLVAQTYDLINYAGGLTGGLTNIALVLPPTVVRWAPLVDTGSAIQLPILIANTLYWDGTPTNAWDVGGNSNWVDVAGTHFDFRTNETVTFDDTASNFTVNVSTAVPPLAMLVKAETNNYLFTGAGSIAGAGYLGKSGAGTLTILNTNGFTGPLTISNGLVSVAAVANGGVASPLGGQSTAATNLVLNGGTLRYTGSSASMNRMFTVGAAGGTLAVTNAAATLTIDGAGWTLGGTLVKRGAGVLRFINYRTSFANAGTDVLVEEGTVNFGTGYDWSSPWATSGNMDVKVTNGAALITSAGAFAGVPWTGEGSLHGVTVERGSTWTIGGGRNFVQGGGTWAVRGGSILGAGSQLTPFYGTTLQSLSSDTNGYIQASIYPYDTGASAVSVEDGAADPDLIWDGNTSAGVATLTKNGPGRLIYRGTMSSATINLTAGITQVGDATQAGNLAGSTINNAGVLAFAQSTTLTEGPVIAGTGTLIQAGSGTTILTAANTYSGATIISNGTLRVNGSLAAGSAVTVTPAGTLAGAGVISGTVALAGTVIPGTGVGTLTTGSETWQGGATYRFEISDMLGTFGTHPGWDRLQVNGGLTISATAASQLTVRVSSVNGAGASALAANLAANTSYTMAIARATGIISGFAANAFAVDLTSFVSPYAVTNTRVQVTGTDVELVLETGAALGALVWDADPTQGLPQDGSGAWDLANTNWLNGTTNVSWIQTSAGVIGADTNSGGSYTVTVAAATVQATSLTFPTGSTYTIAGTNTLSVLGGTLAVSNGAVTISSILGGGGFTKTGPGTLTLTRATTANTYAGPITVAEGTLVAGGSVGDGTIRGDVRINAGTRFQLSAGNVVVNSALFDISAGGLLDMSGFSDAIGSLAGAGMVTNNSHATGLYLDNIPGDRVFSGNIYGNGNLHLRGDTANGVQWLNGTNFLSNVSVEGTSTLRLSSNGVTVVSGAVNVNPGGGLDDGKVIVEQGHYLQAANLYLQVAADHNARMWQHGGTVNIIGAGYPVRIGSASGIETTTYFMNGGVLNVTNGNLSIGWDGYGTLIQTGGVINAQSVQLNANGNGASDGAQWILEGGRINIGSGGIASTVDSTNHLGGGTIGALTNWTWNATQSGNLTGTNGPVRFDPAGFTITVNGPLAGAGGLMLNGTGTIILVAANTFIGNTVVSNGTLRLTGSLANSATVGVNGTLGGTGLVGSALASDGTVAPGSAIGTLRVGFTFSQTAAAKLAIELGGNTPGTYDVLAVAGFATLNGELSVTNVAYTPIVGDSFTVLTASAISGAFLTTNLPVLAAPSFWQVTYNSDSVVLSVAQPPLTPYQQWALAITNAADRSDQSDPDNDSYVNLWEYSQGTDPTNSADGLKVLMVKTNGVFALKFNFVTSAVDIVYHVEAAYGLTNNATWDCITSNYLAQGWTGDAAVTSTNAGPVVQAFAEDNDPFAARRGLRLRIERP